MRKLTVAAILLLAGCTTTPDDTARKQLAYFGPACKKLGYTTQEEISKCVDRKIENNQYQWASTPGFPEAGGMRPIVPVPPEPPARSN
jgi:hypothetical protein